MAERNSNGTFKPGWRGGPGRPPKARERQYLDLAVSTVTPARWKKVVRKALEDAEKGCAVARRWLSDLLIGREPALLRDLEIEVEELRAMLEGQGHAHPPPTP